MTGKSQSLLVITNLYPVPWAPNRASFNKQQFEQLAQIKPVNIVILVGWKEWLENRQSCISNDTMKYCPYFYIPKFGRRLVPFFQLFSLLFCLSWIKKSNPDALLASWGFPDAIAVSMLNKFLKLPFFVKVHGTDVNENTKYSARRALMKKWLNKAETIFCASKALVKNLKDIGIEEKKLQVNYNGVNPDIFYPLASKTHQQHFVFVGSLIATKGCNELIAAFVQLQKTHPNSELDIVGAGPLKSHLLEIIKLHNIQSKVRLLGTVPLAKVAEYIRAANILVLPSYREGVPNVLLEAFASGTPVIATDVGGIPEVINADVGILVPAKDEKSLVLAMIKALESPWSKDKILNHASQFDWGRNIKFVFKHLGDL